MESINTILIFLLVFAIIMLPIFFGFVYFFIIRYIAKRRFRNKSGRNPDENELAAEIKRMIEEDRD